MQRQIDSILYVAWVRTGAGKFQYDANSIRFGPKESYQWFAQHEFILTISRQCSQQIEIVNSWEETFFFI